MSASELILDLASANERLRLALIEHKLAGRRRPNKRVLNGVHPDSWYVAVRELSRARLNLDRVLTLITKASGT